ncbi:aminotransferase [uncultured Sulfitobacter sp.]|uniref:aminotransferase n=1 Tax=uncultured Sulfitobacter sp. TaxID=191468 RepID=UPI00261F7618|nr:aminotransferase [uncultured Sulfitobacter sp.]
MPLPRTATTFAPPVMEARRWLDGVDFAPDRPLINVSQAAPVEPPHPDLRRAIADAALTDDSAHFYGPVLGLLDLRTELAARTQQIYGAEVTADQVCITSGCNQAFAAAIATLCAEDDEVIVPTPWYFNHKMWLDMAGARAIPLKTGAHMLPRVADAAALITPRTRAIVLVTPNNPTGAEYPGTLLDAFFDLARDHGIALIVDETYRDFHAGTGAPHTLFRRPDWDKTLIHLYSFSKAYRLTGHRVGGLVSSSARLAEVEKFLDTVAICPAQLGQHAALWGMRHLDQWLAGERDEILHRRAAISAGFPELAANGWELLGLGGYFAYLRHPFAQSSADLAPALVRAAGVLCLPGTMFYPAGDPDAPAELRIAFANLDATGIGVLFDRLAALDMPLRQAPLAPATHSP